MSLRLALAITIGTVLMSAALVPLMVIFDGARIWIALGSMAIGAALLVWRLLDKRRT